MKRVYTGWRNNHIKFINNNILSYLIEGIQLNGGDIISFQMVPISGSPATTERILIIYEDNGHYDEIIKFLDGKENDITTWTRKIK